MSMYLAGRYFWALYRLKLILFQWKKNKLKKRKKNAYEAFRKRRVVYWKSMGCAVRGKQMVKR